MTQLYKYDFTFTASSLRLKSLVLVAEHLLNGTEIDYINELGNGKSATGKRMLSEFSKRLKSLTKSQLELLVNSELSIQKQIAFLAICKTHFFIRDFVVEVLREKALLYDYEITEGDYRSFIRRKNELHPEMDKITENTQAKIKQVLFKILEQADIIDTVKNKQIQLQILDLKIIKTIAHDQIEWLKVFLMSDADIDEYKNLINGNN